MKKIILAIIIIAICLTTLVSCNMGLTLGKFNFKYIYIKQQDSFVCYEITKWYEVDVGVEVKLKDGKTIFVSEGLYILSDELIEGLK